MYKSISNIEIEKTIEKNYVDLNKTLMVFSVWQNEWIYKFSFAYEI